MFTSKGPGDEATWGSIWHPDDPRAATGPDCEHCGACLDVDDLCVNRCCPNACFCVAEGYEAFWKVSSRLLRLKSSRPEPQRRGGAWIHPPVPAEQFAEIERLDALSARIWEGISDWPLCTRAVRSPFAWTCVLTPQAIDSTLFDVAMAFGQILDDEDARAAGEGPDEEQDEHEADLVENEAGPVSGVVSTDEEESFDAHG